MTHKIWSGEKRNAPYGEIRAAALDQLERLALRLAGMTLTSR